MPRIFMSVILFLFFIFINTVQAIENNCLNMTFEEFDQTQNQGWRALAQQKQFDQAANLLKNYLYYKKRLDVSQRQLLHFHLGQMYAFDKKYDKAVLEFLYSLDPNEPKESPLLWNAYVRGTLCFLKKDRKGLLFYKDQIQNGPLLNGKKANLDVLEKFEKYWGHSYEFAYLAQR